MLHSRSRVVALLIVVGTLSIAATAATGIEPGVPTAIPDSAYRPVSLPPISETSGDGGLTAPGAVGSPAPSAGPRASQLADVREPLIASSPPDRAQPSLGAAKALVVPVATPTPKPKSVGGSSGTGSASSTGHSLRGYASYYCWAGSSPCTYGYPDGGGFQAYAAAGPKLRAALGSNWRGRVVSVDGIAVKLIDWCQCYKGQSNEKLLDLYHDVYARTGSAVVIRW
jgi:hypothetical protein